jgi:V/A-type H+-transporting ATPase subunit B
MRLSEHIYRTVDSLAGPLLFVKNVFAARIGEMVRVVTDEGRGTAGEILSRCTDEGALVSGPARKGF